LLNEIKSNSNQTPSTVNDRPLTTRHKRKMQFLLIHTLKNSVVYYFTMILIQIMKYLNAAQSSRNSDL